MGFRIDLCSLYDEWWFSVSAYLGDAGVVAGVALVKLTMLVVGNNVNNYNDSFNTCIVSNTSRQ